MKFSRFIYRRGGKRIAVYSRRRRISAARKMAALGLPAGAICAALGVKRETVAAICAAALSASGRRTREQAAEKSSIWGEWAGALAEEMRRAA